MSHLWEYREILINKVRNLAAVVATGAGTRFQWAERKERQKTKHRSEIVIYRETVEIKLKGLPEMDGGEWRRSYPADCSVGGANVFLQYCSPWRGSDHLSMRIITGRFYVHAHKAYVYTQALTHLRIVIIKADSKHRNSDSGGGSMLECMELKIMPEWACIVLGAWAFCR